MTGTIVILLIVVVVIGGGMLAIFSLTRGRGGLLDREKFQSAWLKIENNLDKKNMATYRFAMISADALLDEALRDSGVKGETMGERLKNAKTKFAKIDQVWTVHKLRNKIAHEPDAKIPSLFLKKALSTYKNALKELGAI